MYDAHFLATLGSTWSHGDSRFRGPQDGRRRAVVFLDEAGLPQEKVESLKAIHYHLDAGRHVKQWGPLVG